MNEMDQSILEKASGYPGGATPFNIFQEAVNHLVIDRFASLAARLEGESPTTQDLADTVIQVAEQIHDLNPGHIPKKQYEDYMRKFREHPEIAEYLRPVYEAAVRL
jgi:hypothetical protein